MIDYLQQLERDLVEAIDQRSSAPGRRRPFPRVRLEVVAAGAALAAAIALVLLLGTRHETQNEAVQRPTTQTVTHGQATPIPKGTPLRMAGGLRRIGPTTWSGPVRGTGGSGTLTLTGQADLAQRPCCDTPRSLGPSDAHVLRFRWTTPSGVLGGCVVNTVYRRPHARFVWDGPGRVTNATGAFARYRGRSIAIAGATDIALTSRARIVLSSESLRPPGAC